MNLCNPKYVAIRYLSMNQLEVELAKCKAENGLRRLSRGVSRAEIPSSGRIEPRDFGRTPEDIFPIRVRTKMK
jgi:hypothetical protein